MDVAREAELLWPDGLGTALALASSRALAARRGAEGCPVPAAPQWTNGRGRHARRVVDTSAVADWLVGQFPEELYGGLVLGSPHGAAVHLATALGVPWLPVSFEVPTPEVEAGNRPSTWLAEGERGARVILAANHDVTVRQVFDPGTRLAYAVVRWQRLPSAYREFIADRLQPGAPVVVVRDVSRWLTVPGEGGFSFQLGSRASGLSAGEHYADRDARGFGRDLPDREDSDGDRSVDRGLVEDLRRFSSAFGHSVRQVLYRHPDVLSGAVADLHRLWLHQADRSGNRLVVECGRLLDPWHILRAGLVPYWCEHPLRTAVRALGWWLAGSRQYTSIDVLAEPPGLPLTTTAGLDEWQAVARFATRDGLVDRRCVRAYPLGGVPADHATTVLRGYPDNLPFLPQLEVGPALRELAGSAQTDGLLVL